MSSCVCHLTNKHQASLKSFYSHEHQDLQEHKHQQEQKHSAKTSANQRECLHILTCARSSVAHRADVL